MDSRLLNVFHDDPFDGNYGKFDNDPDFWSSGSETMGLQLSETLHGILPMAPTDDASSIYGTSMLKDDYALDGKDDALSALQGKNALLFDDFAEHHVGAGGAIEIVTVDPNAIDTDDEDDDSTDADEIDNRSQHSFTTFRSRTDSSSIGDYESHSSDYDDDDDDDLDDDTQFLHVPDLAVGTAQLMLENHFKLPLEAITNNCKSRTFSTNTICSDVDGLGLQIDASTFDLAEFITKDDFAMASTSALKIDDKPLVTPVIPVKAALHNDSDSDSDVIVDVETVEFEAESDKELWLEQQQQPPLVLQAKQAELQVEETSNADDAAQDPCWSPETHLKKEPKTALPATMPLAAAQPQQQHNFSRNFSVVPSKRQCDFLKGKFGAGRGKNAAVQRSSVKSANKTVDSKTDSAKKEEQGIKTQSVPTRKMGMGRGGKNLALIQRYSISEQSSEEYATPVKEVTAPAPLKIVPTASTTSSKLTKQLPVKTPLALPAAVMTSAETVVSKAAVKRKLNLEEYKKRRGEPINTNNVAKYKIPRMDTARQTQQLQEPEVTAAGKVVKHSDAVTSVVKSLKEQTNLQQHKSHILDPITEAKNKVLRMQELKKAQLLKIIDSAVTAKVPRVTKVLPLKDMVKGSYGAHNDEQTNTTKSHPDYEEIVIVSASCNTEISIPPMNVACVLEQTNNASRSLLKSSALLYNISNSFQKVQADENVKLSTNTLIASIQDVVAKQAAPVDGASASSTVSAVNRNSGNNVAAATVIIASKALSADQHGEDKVIMHLRKDRIRKRNTATISTQTELIPEFPPLPMPKGAYMERKSRDRKRRRIRRNYRLQQQRHSDSSTNRLSGNQSSCSESSRDEFRSRSRSIAAAEDNYSSSTERQRRSEAGAGGYSSRSSRHHRSSISSSYSESDRNLTRRSRKSNYKMQRSKKYSRSSSNSSSAYSDRSRTRSRSPLQQRSPARTAAKRNNSFVDRNVSQPAVEERRIVYVGRIEQETSKEMLRRKFIAYGPIKQITIHYKDTGMKYGFVTYERSQDAFTVIDTNTRDPQINMYDISFGGRRAFCRASYADLDNAGINTYQSYVFPKAAAPPKEEDSFEALLQKVKAKMSASKTATNATDSKI